MQVCFIGHRTIKITKELIFSLKDTVITLINKGATTFLFGSMSDFDNLAWETVTNLKTEYPFIKRVYVRSNYQYIDKLYEDYLLTAYEETYFSPRLKNAGKYSYVERNYEMIDNATYCVFYYDKNYVPQPKLPTKKHTLPTRNRNGGTKIAYDYAIKKRKEIINLCNP